MFEIGVCPWMPDEEESQTFVYKVGVHSKRFEHNYNNPSSRASVISKDVERTGFRKLKACAG